MLLLTEVKLKNACQHSELHINIQQGLTALIGPNGSGKSSILRLIAYAITGLVDPAWGTQQNLQKDGELTAGYASVTLTENDDTYVIKRYFQDTTKLPDTILKNGEYIATKRANVDTAMTELTGIDKYVLFQLIWSRQEELNWLLVATPTTINAFLTRLFDLSHVNKLRQVLLDAVNSIYDIPPITDIDAAKNDRTTLQDIKSEKENNLAQAEERRHNLETRLTELMENTKGKMPFSLWNSRLQEKTTKLAQQERKIDSFREYSENDLAAMAGSIAQVDRLQARMEILKARMTKLQDAANTYTQLTKQTQTNIADIDKMLGELTSITADTSTCKYCGAIIAAETDYLDKIARLNYGYKDYCTMVDSIPEKLMEQHAKNKLYSDKIQRINAIIKKIKDITAELNDAIAVYARQDKEYREYLQKKQDRSQTCTNILMLKAQIEELRNTPYIPEEQDKELTQLRTDCDKAQREVNTISEELAVLTERIDNNESYIAKREQESVQQQINATAKRNLSEIRSAMGSSRAQARYIEQRISDLNAMLASYMELTDLPFTLYLDTKTHMFRYKSADGYEHPAGHLSGAQMKISSMLLQICLMRTMRPNIALQMQDEVDASLDPANRIMLASLLAMLRTSVRGSLLIVTREQETIEQCSDIVELSAGD